MAPYDGGNNSSIRYKRTSLTSSGVQVMVEEDTTYDTETGHATEAVSYLAIQGDGLLTGWPHLETKYYYAAGQRVAMRRGGVVYYLHTDHLGSTSLATNSDGVELDGSRTLYYPYGEVRWSDGTLPTDYTFTGQRDAGLGLMDYRARFCDPFLGRFISADSIVPEPGNPQSLNRYSYVLGNPLKYTDPTGHRFKPPRRPRISIDISGWNPKVVQALDVVQETARTVAELPPIIAGPVAAARSFVKHVNVDSEAGTMVVGNRDPVSASELTLEIAGVSAVIAAPSAGLGDAVDNLDEVVETAKPYSNPRNRPPYADGQVEQVWENAKGPAGKVYDPFTGEELQWDRTRSRAGQWDMGHRPGHEYNELWQDYMDDVIDKKAFLREYRDPDNYFPQSVYSNRCHRFEQ